jgi:hypothetical protein
MYGWQIWREVFCICRYCSKSTIFVVSERGTDQSVHIKQVGGIDKVTSANNFVKIESYVSQRDAASMEPPEYLPPEIEAVFKEGATCLAVGCFNAAGTMFRLSVDLATKSLLPSGEVNGLNNKIRRNLGFRLPWLFDQGLLPEALRELSSCIKEDGNDGAHEGTLVREDADDLLDFTVALLERLYTEPERLKLAKERREKRRG